jgi:hypothetical protein
VVCVSVDLGIEEIDGGSFGLQQHIGIVEVLPGPAIVRSALSSSCLFW